MHRLPLFVIWLIIFFQPVYGQQWALDTTQNTLKGSAACGIDILQYKLRQDAAFRAREQTMNRLIAQSLSNTSDTIITLPVVVHVISSNPGYITDVQIMDGIQDLNDAFSKTGLYSASAGADTKIKFCLAKINPDGGITTGITRTISAFGEHINWDNEDERLKELINWDPTRYVNIWLVNSIEGEAYADFRCGVWYRLRVNGYATMPPPPLTTDGIVVSAFGPVLTHEMGHYLGLYHTFEGGCYNNNCLTDGDRVCDTPPDKEVRPSPSCTNPNNTCITDTLSNYSNGAFTFDVPDQIANFMDYGNGNCSNLFSTGQKDRMRAAINTLRTGLLEYKCNPPCAENLTASFIVDIPRPLPGDAVTFTSTSTPTSFTEWYIDGVLVSTATTFVHTFNDLGKYKLMLKVYNTTDCYASEFMNVFVTCGVLARFYPNKVALASMAGIYEDSILFTNTSINAQTFQWIVSNNVGMAEQVVSTSQNLVYTFPTPATYSIKLIASNALGCADTSNIQTIIVTNPTTDAYPMVMSILCSNQNTIRVNFCIGNAGYAPIPQGTPVSFYSSNPYNPGAVRLSPVYYLPQVIPGGGCYACFAHFLNVPYRYVTSVYMVINDSGLVVPVSLPNATLIESNYNNNLMFINTVRTTVVKSICEGQSYLGYSSTGTYIDTLFSIVTGCDSIRTLLLTVKPVVRTYINATICEGSNYLGYTTSGTYLNTFTGVNSCDSIRTLYLTVLPKSFKTIDSTICEGQSVAGYTTTGTYIDIFPAANGCDSIRTLTLIVKPKKYSSITAAICFGENYAGHTTTGTYIDTYTASNGCDSIRTLQLIVKNPVINYLNITLCAGQSYAGYTASGMYTDVFLGSNGCDSTRVLTLTINQPVFTTYTAAICEGQSFEGYNTSGTYVNVFTGINGCDSTRTLHLIVKPHSYTTYTISICEGEQYEGYNQSGIYVSTFTAANGCDSIRTLRLIVNPVKRNTVNASICFGSQYYAQGNWQTSAGTYYDTLNTYQGCDSIVITHLTVNPLPQPALGNDRDICAGEIITLSPGTFNSYIWNTGSTQSFIRLIATGSYWVKVTNNFGCAASDTIRIIRMREVPAGFLPEDSTLCKGKTYTINAPAFENYLWNTGATTSSIVITQPGKYTLRVMNIYGCYGTDSLKIFYEDCAEILIPNAFTPNNDGLNDDFKPLITTSLKDYRMRIYNRTGKVMFETEEILKGWDGKYNNAEQPVGAYIYLISYINQQSKKIIKKGSLILIR